MYEVVYRDRHRLISSMWRARVDVAGRYLESANEYWGIAFTRLPDGAVTAELVGPSPVPRTLDGVVGASHWGVEFRPEVAVARLPKATFTGRFVSLVCADGLCSISGEQLPIPAFEGLESFVDDLDRKGVVYFDDLTARALRGDRSGYSTRSWQRRVKDVTGLSLTRIKQFVRVRAAEAELRKGRTATEVAADLGFADQAHLTRSFVSLRAERPSRIRRDQ